MHYQYATTMTKLHQSMGIASSHQWGSLQPLVAHFFTRCSNFLVFFTTCSSFHSFYGKALSFSCVQVHSSNSQHSLVFLFHFHMFKFTPPIHYPHSLFFFSIWKCDGATIKIIVVNEFSPIFLHLQKLVLLCFEVAS
jgi:hypothetical protein